MARPIKRGLDYFSVDCHLDDKVLYLEAKHGLIGYAILVKLWARIYKSEGYFCDWKEKNIYLFCKEVSAELTTVNDVVNTCFEEGIFSKLMHNRHKILTSKGIQKRWQKIVTEAKRKDTEIEPIFNLIEFTPEETELTPEETPQSTGNTPEESTQSKVKKRKGDKKKELTDPLAGLDEEEIEIWESFTAWFKEGEFKVVSKIENQLEPKQLFKLLENYDATEIKETLMSLENYKKAKDYTSVYLTLNKWLKNQTA